MVAPTMSNENRSFLRSRSAPINPNLSLDLNFIEIFSWVENLSFVPLKICLFWSGIFVFGGLKNGGVCDILVLIYKRVSKQKFSAKKGHLLWI